MTTLSLRHLSVAPFAGSRRASAGARAPLGARLGDVYASGTRGGEAGLGLNGRTMQDIRGFRPWMHTIGAGVGRGGLTPQE